MRRETNWIGQKISPYSLLDTGWDVDLLKGDNFAQIIQTVYELHFLAEFGTAERKRRLVKGVFVLALPSL